MDDGARLVAALGALGLVGGLVLLARGLAAYRRASRIAGIGTSRVETAAAGEVRLVGTVEADVVTLVSPLQGAPCVYFRSRVVERAGRRATTVLDEERAVGFRLRDDSGSIRVFPRGARWDLPLRFDASSAWDGEDPPGLARNAGPTSRPAVEDREAAIARLLTVQAPGPPADEGGGTASPLGAALGGGLPGVRRREYEERRLEPGDVVTLVGSALPFGDLDDAAGADRLDPGLGLEDPEVALNLAEAQAAGTLRATAAEAWGNAAIPGFGIGRPARAPDLDPAAAAPAIAPAEEAAAAAARFDIPAGELVVAATPGQPLAVISGRPAEIDAREGGRFLVGLAGAILAIAGSLALAAALAAARG